MGKSEDYDILPHKQVEELKKQIEAMKGHKGSPNKLQDSLESLNKNVDSLLSLFKHAIEEIKLEEHDEYTISRRLDPVMEKLNIIISQNEKMATALMGVMDMLKEEQTVEHTLQHEIEGLRGVKKAPPFKPYSEAPQRTPPPPRMPQQAGPAKQDDLEPLPPFPPPRKKKKGLFGFKK